MAEQFDFITSGVRTVELEYQSVKALIPRIDQNFSRACELMLACKGRVIVSGMGKSGHIGKKIAATLASTGTLSFFVHPAEASHGDLGMITARDVVIGISNSGNTSELVSILPLIKRMGTPLISMTGSSRSALAQLADVNLDISVQTEACPLNLAPTSSTTATLAMGDALAIALLEARGFSAEDFAYSHPGGSLGRKLLLKVSDVMHSGDRIPRIPLGTLLSATLLEMSSKGLGMAMIIDEQGQLAGVYTDGDLRRTLDKNLDIHQTLVDDVMTRDCRTVKADILAAEALAIMEEYQVNGLPVIDDLNQCIGALNMHDLLRAGVL